VAVISGYHVDEYCLKAFREAVKALQRRLEAVKVTDFSTISPGDFIARVPPKIMSDSAAGALRQIPVYQIEAVGDDFAEDGSLVRSDEPSYLYFESRVCYLLDLNPEEPRFEASSEFHAGAIDCFDGREIGQVKEKHNHLDEDLRGILYRIPAERVTGDG
jgi:hypothetical protein